MIGRFHRSLIPIEINHFVEQKKPSKLLQMRTLRLFLYKWISWHALIPVSVAFELRRIQEHEATVKMAAAERPKRENYRPVLEHDGLIWHRSQLEVCDLRFFLKLCLLIICPGRPLLLTVATVFHAY